MRLRERAPIVVSCAVILVCAAAGPVAAGTSASSPPALYSALLKAPVSASDLPHGYKKPVVGAYPLSSKAKSHHAVGGVQIQANGGNAAVIYIVFATNADAKADWDNANYKGTTTQAAPGSIPKPSIIVNASVAGANGTKTGVTDVACLYRNVIVQAATASTKSTKHGDLAGAVALETFAIAHLRSLRGPAA